ncbi:formate--tetrahydrofolate ligase, partial [Staphylococcus aureus]|uniref:formate--tetrahydrofolate ligase n=1 Tax=Staphylococcus aureus TaxID=1280 RepID=UPI00210BC1B1
MNIEKAKRLAKEKLPEKRYNHSLRVAETAIKLAEIYDGDTSKAREAGFDPAAVVVVATIRALKMHGGVAKDN